MIRWIIFIAILLIIDIYSYQAFRTVFSKEKWFLLGYQIFNLLAIVFIVYSFTQFDRSVGQNARSLFTIGLLLVLYVPKLILTFLLLSEDIFRLIRGSINYFVNNHPDENLLPSRRKFVSVVALSLAAIPFGSLIYGIFEGKYNYKVIRQKIYFDDLPEAFDGFKITQISDIHSGSFDDAEKIKYAIDLINEQESDLLLFTGDLVNNHASEMHPWIEIFKGIKPFKFGKYSVLGNHDYGEYVTWNSKEEKLQNFEEIKDLHQKINFELLLNENRTIHLNDQSIEIVGVENWGEKFKKAGDLKKASENLSSDSFKILMSHDPSHWNAEVKNNPIKYQLTLAGHTHGMQFGIEIPGFLKWSPVQYVYQQWAGLYQESDRYLYVNRGFGFHAYPGRVGIWPEITVLELKKGKKL